MKVLRVTRECGAATVHVARDVSGYAQRRLRRLTEAARAQLVATEWARRAVVSDLISSVATAYFDLRTLDQQLAISQRTLASRQESLRLIQTLVNGGGAPLSDQRQAEQLVESAAAAIPNLEREMAFGNGEVQLLAAWVPVHLVGKPVRDLAIPGEIRVALIVRMGKGVVPVSGTALEEDDQVYVVIHQSAVEKFQKMMGWKS